MRKQRWMAAAVGAMALAALIAVSRAVPTTAQPGPMPGPMHGQPANQDGSNDFDRAWLYELIMHHAMAVMMARPVTERAQHPELRDLATAIVADQTREIVLMRGWLQDWYGLDMPDPVMMMDELHAGRMLMGGMAPGMMPGAAGMPAHGDTPMPAGTMPNMAMMDMMMDMMMSMMNDYAALPAPRLEAVFMSLMIPHHEGAVEMAQEAVGRAVRPEVKDLATRIIAAQSAEIDQMNRWLADWYGL